MGYVDADTHVVECEDTWSFMTGDDERFRPIAIETDLRGGARFWLIGDQRLRRGLNSEVMPAAVREMRDIPGRLRAMDALGVEIQVLHPTALLMWSVQRPDAELALARSYNRWMAQAWEQEPKRFAWSAVPAIQSLHRMEEELRYCKDHGACGVLMRGFEAGRLITDPYFDPLWAIAQDLDLAICVHVGTDNASRDAQTFISRMPPKGYAITTIVPNIAAAFAVLVSDLSSRFPRLRFAFLESGSQWISFALKEAERARELPERPLEAANIWVACQVNDDLPYVLRDAGEGQLIVGTDFGHADLGSDIEAHRILEGRSDVDREVLRRIVDGNARTVFGLPQAPLG